MLGMDGALLALSLVTARPASAKPKSFIDDLNFISSGEPRIVRAAPATFGIARVH
jgi:hypothetical protein